MSEFSCMMHEREGERESRGIEYLLRYLDTSKEDQITFSTKLDISST